MGKTALLVIDDQPLHAQLAPALTGAGWNVVSTRSGKDAQAALDRDLPGLLVVDGLLPDTDGVSFVTGLRKAGNRVPIAFVSAFWRDLETFRRLTEDLAVAVVVHKPVNVEAFMEQVGKAIEGVPQHQLDAAAELDLLQAMAALKQEYAKALPRKLGELAHAIYLAKSHPDDPVLLNDARGQAHRLRGTAAVYGFPVVGTTAAQIEDLLIGSPLLPAHHRPNTVEPATWVEVEKELASAVQSLEAVPNSPVVPGNTTMRVLAVDPDPGFLHYLVELGRHRLVEIVPARTAAEALEEVARTRFEAAIIDENLGPEGAAYRLAFDLRALPGLGALPLAFLSSDGQDIKRRVAAAHAGASLYLCKPLDADSFSAAVHQLAASRSSEQPHILLVDDDSDYSSHVSVLLRHEQMRVSVVNDPSQVLKALEDSPVDLVVLDANMPGLSGFDVCRVLRLTPRWQDIPILFVTAESAPAARTAAFEAGADDYLMKPIVREELLGRIRIRVERQRLLRERSERDGVTGLLLRRAFINGLNPRLVEARRHNWPLAVCLLDLDHFKKVNDEHGHLAGDRVLASLGGLLDRRFRTEDLRGRWGGEEFILAFPREGPEAVQVMVARVLDELQALPFTGDEGEIFHVSFSAGVAVFPDDASTVDALLKVADRRLYEAKEAGRRRVVTVG